MNYAEALSYLTSKLKFGIHPGLDQIEAILKRLDSPHLAYPVIQITGTNGKTSVAWLTTRVLQAHDLKVGTYTSPHLISYRERIQVGGEQVSEEEMANLMTTLKPLIDEVEAGGKLLTEFEVLTALGYTYFAKEQVDSAVVEVGMGGRWDATSVVKPKVAVITNVELEHTDRLGTTREKIAWEKAHIIKGDSSAVTGTFDGEIASIIGERCLNQETSWKMLGRDFSVLGSKVGETQKFSIQGVLGRYRDLSLPLLGRHQVENAALAIEAAELFLERPLNLPALQKALEEVSCPGRLEIVQKNPLVLLDGAHNPAGMRALAETLKEKFKDKITLVLAVLADKDIKGIIKAVSPVVSSLIISENKSDRSAQAKDLAALAASLCPETEIEVKPDLKEALSRALEKSGQEGVVCVTGSLYTVGEIKEFLEGKRSFLGKIE